MFSRTFVTSITSATRRATVARTFSYQKHIRFTRYFASSNSNEAVGFIGLGNMGGPMAKNLLKSGFQVNVFDMNAEAIADLKADGAVSASSPAEIASKCTTIVTMLPSSPHVLSVYEDIDNGILTNVQKGSLLIDASTIDPTVARQVANKAADHGAAMLDAPVSGGVIGAAAGTLTFMCGGADSAFERAKPILNAMGSNIVHCGGPGNGQVVKICNNLVLAISMSGVSEAMNLGVTLGMDPKVLAGIFNTSSARCWSSDTYNPVPGVMENVPSARNYEGGFGAALMAKDVGLAIDAANAVKAPLLLGGSALQLYNLLCKKGLGNKDFSVVYKFISEEK